MSETSAPGATPGDPSSTPTPTPTAPTTATAAPAPKKKSKRGRKSAITEEFWAELRELYESGNYSQRELAGYCMARGIRISQSAISRRVIDEGWVKGVRIEEIRKQLRDEIIREMGDYVRRMLDQHRQQSQVAIAEVLLHFKDANDRRKIDPTYKMPAQAIAALAPTLDRLQVMEARATGFNYREGRPFKSDEEDPDKQPKEMKIRVLTPEEEEEIQRKADELEDDEV